MIPFGSEQIAKEALDNIGYTGTIVPATNALDKLYEANADKENP
jgi:hypothetical protein